MGAIPNEPSMEDILSSIKRIIADGDRSPAARARRRAGRDTTDTPEGGDTAQADAYAAGDDEATDTSILDLGDYADTEEATTRDPDPAAYEGLDSAPTEPVPLQTAPVDPDGILSDTSAAAARQSLVHLSSLLVRPEEGEPNTLEALVRELLRPMMKDWLEARLPELVEAMVKKEIDRIVGRLG